jgi:putative hydrolase of the HAD superfamily
MDQGVPIRTLFVDIGGVLLTNGWDRQARELAATFYKLDLAEINDRHQLTVETYELGELTLDEYLKRTVFYEDRPFSRAEFREFMYKQSLPHPQMIELIRRLKAQFGLKIVVVSNEGRDLNSYRIHKFKLSEFVDFFVSSCFVRLRKPDLDIYRMALDMTQTPPAQVAYIDNLLMFVQIAQAEGIQGIHHTDYMSTRTRLAQLGLEIAE